MEKGENIITRILLSNSNWRNSILTGLLLVLSWPPISFTGFLFIAFVPLFYTLSRVESWKKGFLYSYFSLLIWTIGTMYWIGNLSLTWSGRAIILLAFIIIPLTQFIPIGLFLWVKLKYKKDFIWLFLPFVWVGYEYFQNDWDLSFNWLHLGLGLTPFRSLIQFYEYTGHWGGTSFVLAVNGLIFFLLKRKDKGKRVIYGYSLLILLFIIGNLISSTSSIDTNSKKIKVAVIQPNINPYISRKHYGLKEQVNELAKLILPFRDSGIDLVICSEGFLKDEKDENPLVINHIDKHPAIKSLKGLSKVIGAPIITGFLGFKLHGEKKENVSSRKRKDGLYYDNYNGALLLAHDIPTQITIKKRLTPFMERVPFLNYFSGLESLHLKINQTNASYDNSLDSKVLTYKDMRIATLVCYEATFSDYVRGLISNDANLVAIVTNEAWAGKTSGYGQNASYTKALAVSFRKYIARSANTGTSLFMDSQGRVLEETKWKRKKVIVEDLMLDNSRTVYTQYGNVLGIISMMFFIGFLILGLVLSFVKFKK